MIKLARSPFQSNHQYFFALIIYLHSVLPRWWTHYFLTRHWSFAYPWSYHVTVDINPMVSFLDSVRELSVISDTVSTWFRIHSKAHSPAPVYWHEIQHDTLLSRRPPASSCWPLVQTIVWLWRALATDKWVPHTATAWHSWWLIRVPEQVLCTTTIVLTGSIWRCSAKVWFVFTRWVE